MGLKHSATANWTMDEWAYGTAKNAVPLEDAIQEATKLPAKYFGGEAIENDASMHQIQHELLSFDDTLKRLFFWRKKKKPSKTQQYSDEYYYHDQQYYDQSKEYYDPSQQYDDYNQDTIFEEVQSQPYDDHNQDTIFKEDRSSLPTDDVDEYQSPTYENTNRNSSWRCGYCGTENQATHLGCRKCRQIETNV